MYQFISIWFVSIFSYYEKCLRLNINIPVFVWAHIFISAIYVGVELLGHTITACLTFWWIVIQSGCTILLRISIPPHPHQHLLLPMCFIVLPGWHSQYSFGLRCGRPGFDSWVRKIPWRRAWQPTPVFFPGKSPWTEEPGGLQSMGSQRVGYDWATKHSTAHVFYYNYSRDLKLYLILAIYDKW